MYIVTLPHDVRGRRSRWRQQETFYCARLPSVRPPPVWSAFVPPGDKRCIFDIVERCKSYKHVFVSTLSPSSRPSPVEAWSRPLPIPTLQRNHICERHCSADEVLVDGAPQRFCQQVRRRLSGHYFKPACPGMPCGRQGCAGWRRGPHPAWGWIIANRSTQTPRHLCTRGHCTGSRP